MVNPEPERRHTSQNPCWPPVSHRDDPETSHEAEAVITQTGKRQTHAAKVMGIVTAHPGLTTGAIGEISGLGQMETRKRLSDVKNRGLARQGQSRIWQGSGRQNVTWWPVKLDRKALDAFLE